MTAPTVGIAISANDSQLHRKRL